MVAGSNNGFGSHPRRRIRGVPGNGRPRAKRLAAGTLGAALIGTGPAGFSLQTAPAASAATSAGTSAQASVPTAPQGYRLVGGDGGIFNYKTNFYGSMAGQSLAAPVVGGVSMPDGSGYWLVGSDGGVFAFGRAGFFGSLWGIKLTAPIVGIAPTSDGRGYWLVGKDGGIFAFGDAGFEGSLVHTKLGGPVVGITGDTVDHSGYWVAAADGGVFALGHARFHGSAVHDPLRGPISGITAAPGGGGYWLSGVDGGVFSFGADFYGSRGTSPAPFNTVGIETTPSGHGYWLATSDGNVYPFGDAVNLGSLRGQHLVAPIVGITGRAGGPLFTGSYPRPLWVGVSTDTSQGGVGGDDTPTFTHGTAPYKAQLAPGSHLPPGLLLESDGTLRGDPAAPAEFTVVFTDAKGNQTNVPVSVGYAPTGYIATLAGGPISGGTPAAPGARPANAARAAAQAIQAWRQAATKARSALTQSTSPHGQTTLPAPDGSTVASGTGYPGGNGDSGASTGSQVYMPPAVAVGPDGTVYFSEEPSGGSPDVRSITPDGIIHTFAGGGSTTPTSDGTPVTDASLGSPTFLAVDGRGNVIVGDTTANQIYVVPTTSGSYYGQAMVAGNVYLLSLGDASGSTINGLAVDPDGTIYWSDSETGTIWKLTDADAVSTAVDGSTATVGESPALSTPAELAVDPVDHSLYLANCNDTGIATECTDGVVEELTSNGLADVAGGFQSDIGGLAVDTSHNVYISDVFGYGVGGAGAKTWDDLVLKVAAGSGTPKVIAGQSPQPPPPDSQSGAPTFAPYQTGVPADSSGVDIPFGLAFDSTTRNLLIAQAFEPGSGIAGVGAKAVRIVSNADQAQGSPYQPGGVSSS